MGVLSQDPAATAVKRLCNARVRNAQRCSLIWCNGNGFKAEGMKFVNEGTGPCRIAERPDLYTERCCRRRNERFVSVRTQLLNERFRSGSVGKRAGLNAPESA